MHICQRPLQYCADHAPSSKSLALMKRGASRNCFESLTEVSHRGPSAEGLLSPLLQHITHSTSFLAR